MSRVEVRTITMIPISVCIIGKNEEQHMENCLAPLASLPFEVVYVDTGSTDRTKETAAKYGAKIYDSNGSTTFPPPEILRSKKPLTSMCSL